MQDPRFSDSVLGGQFTTLGRNLRPFSYWHLFQLEACNSPFLDGKGIEDVAPLAIALDAAVRICRTRYPKTAKAAPKLLRRVAVWRFRNLEADALGFAEYISFYTQRPQFWIPEDATATRGQMPNALAGVSALMLLGLSEKEAWDYPVGRGEWMKAARGAHGGEDLDFIMPESEEGMAKLDLLRDGMAELCEALKTNGDAITPASALKEGNMLTEECYELILEWKKARGGKRKALLAELEHEIPDLTLDD